MENFVYGNGTQWRLYKPNWKSWWLDAHESQGVFYMVCYPMLSGSVSLASYSGLIVCKSNEDEELASHVIAITKTLQEPPFIQNW